MIATAVFNAYVIYKHPEYEEQTQLNDLEQRGPGSFAEAASGTAGDMSAIGYAPPSANDLAGAGVAWAQQNPDAALRGAQAAGTWAQDNPAEAQRFAGAIADL